MAAQVVAKDRPETAGCLLNWFIKGGDGQIKLAEIMEQYPSKQATSTVYAVATMACDDL
nr:hypothetical protein GCM10011355_30330 [Aquisalinus luteolus]